MSEAAGAIYEATVVHRRFTPVRHELRYRASYLFLDIDRLGETAASLRLFGRRRGLFVVRDRDLGPEGEGPLSDRVRALLDRRIPGHGVERLMALCLPRSLGYVFNPLTTYFGYGADGELRATVYEVSNTFGERRHYVLPVGGDEAGQRRQQACEKTLYVSPFNEADGHYDFTFMAPADRLRLTVTLSRDDTRILSAWIAGERRPLSDGQILRAFLRQPFLTYGVIAGIHREALKLWRKGLTLKPRPRAGKTETTGLPAGEASR